LGDVTGSIEVSMEFKPAGTAKELGTVPVTFIDVSASRTFLRGVPGIHEDNSFTEIFRFVPDKLFDLVERPVPELAIKRFPAPILHTDFGQIFECKHSIGELNNLLRDTVIDVSHKPSFSTGHFAEFPLCGSSAFGLEFGSEMGVFTTDVLHSRRIKKCVIGADCDVNDSTVNPEDVNFVDGFGSPDLKLAVQVKPVLGSVEGQSRGFNFPREVLPVVFWDTECDFDPAIRGRDGCIPGFKTNADYPLVVSHCRELFTERFMRTLDRFQRFTRNVSCTLHKRGREIRYRLSNVLISGVVAVNLTYRPGFKTPCRTDVKSHGIISHSFHERLPAIRRNRKFQLNCPNHSHISASLKEILNGGDADALLPNLKFGVSALHL
jgi:hypothetical protein